MRALGVLAGTLLALTPLIFVSACGSEETAERPLMRPGLTLATATDGAQTGIIFFAPGWGYDKSRLWRRAAKRYYGWLAASGVAEHGVVEIEYDYRGTPAEITETFKQTIGDTLARLPAGTQFDVIGHSFGGFAGLYGALTAGFESQFRQFVSVAGLPHGYNMNLCGKGWCGSAAQLVVPIYSPFIMQFEQQYAEALNQIRTCSLYSPDDKVLTPFDAGKFPNGINVSIDKMGHLAAVTEQRFLNDLLRVCYGMQ